VDQSVGSRPKADVKKMLDPHVAVPASSTLKAS